MKQEKFKKDLQSIIDICDDGVKGYRTAANNIELAELKTLFLRIAQERKGYIEDLKNEALKEGVELDTSGTVLGFFHRTWLAAKSTFSTDTNEKVIEESIYGENQAIEVYDKVIGNPEIPAFIREKLQEQQQLIKVAIQQLNELKSKISK